MFEESYFAATNFLTFVKQISETAQEPSLTSSSYAGTIETLSGIKRTNIADYEYKPVYGNIA